MWKVCKGDGFTRLVGSCAVFEEVRGGFFRKTGIRFGIFRFWIRDFIFSRVLV